MCIMTQTDKKASVSVAEAKRGFSDLLGRVAYGGESIVITRHGRPMAKLVPADRAVEKKSLAECGWLEDDDPFFTLMDEIVAARKEHYPRASGGRSRRRRGRASE